MSDTVKLYELVGEVVSDIAYARMVADKHSCMLSEKYISDPYMSGLPVPHFTISQAEINIPVIIKGVQTDKIIYTEMRDNVMEITEKTANTLLFKIVTDTILKAKKKADEKAAKESSDSEETPATPKPEYINKNMSLKYANDCHQICKKLFSELNKYLDKNNSHTFKKIEMADALTKNLNEMLIKEFGKYDPNELAGCGADEWNVAAKQFRIAMINEYDQLFKLNSYVIVDSATGKINEFGNDKFISTIKLILKEQDIELAVKESGKTGEVVRSLALY